MTVLSEVLAHPATREAPVATVGRWVVHNLLRRIRPYRDITVDVGDRLLTGPVSHPSINYATYIRGGHHDHDVWVALATILDPGDTFIDVGASIGDYSVQADKFIGVAGRIIAVETDDAQIPYLTTNLARLSASTEVVNRAVADSHRYVAFIQSGPTIGYFAADPNGPIEALSLDELIDPLPESGRGVMKVDVEGWEPAVLLGAIRLLETCKAIVVEARGHQRRCPVEWDEAVAAVQDAGFIFTVPVADEGRIDIDLSPTPEAPGGDYLLLREDIVEKVATAVSRSRRA